MVVRVGICGLGTVGSGTLKVLTRNANEINLRAGRQILISQVGARRDHQLCDLYGTKVTRNLFEVVRNQDVVVELIGGDDVARKLVLLALAHGKHIVTANKALIAVHGVGEGVEFEAAVAGGIPVIKALRDGLAANRIHWLAGILNGTGNYILTQMHYYGRSYDDVLTSAQALGYAEADPTLDISGIDAAQKLTILASIAYGVALKNLIYTEGIADIAVRDIEQADSLGYQIKHLGISRRTERGLELRVHPTLIPKECILASVPGVKNAIEVMGDAVGPTLYYGAGAGAEPTASAVIADLLSLSAHHIARHMAKILPIEYIDSASYLRIHAGVLAMVASILSCHQISIHHISIDREVAIMLTHVSREANINSAIRQLKASRLMRIRVEQ